jgi:hypothetical protein
MPSNAFGRWTGERSAALDEIENAHASVGGTGPGRRFLTQQLNRAYAVMLAAQFQGYCRDLHTECIGQLILPVPVELRDVVDMQYHWSRALDRGNASAGNIGSDFGRFLLSFWASVQAADSRNQRRRELLDELNVWRNAIAHQDLDPAELGGTTTLHLATVRQWRSALNGLAASFDEVMRQRLVALLGSTPWA